MSAGARIALAALAAAFLAALFSWLRLDRAGEAAAVAAAQNEPRAAVRAPSLSGGDDRSAATVEAPKARAEPEPEDSAAAPAAATAELSGWLLVHGGPPPEPITLTLLAPESNGELRETVQTTRADGGFRFGGLAADWRGTLRVSPCWSFAPPDHRGYGEPWHRLDAPARGLELAVHPLVCLRGRVVDCASGAPVAGAPVEVQPGRGPLHGGRSDAQGRFALPVGREDFGSAFVSVSQADGIRASTAEFRREDLGEGLDVGDVCLAAPRELAFLVTDAAGAGIAGAAGRVVRGSALARADAQGRGVLRGLPEGELLLRFAADGFRAAEATVVPGQAEVTVQLARGNRLTIQITGDPAVVAGADLELHGPRLLFTDTGDNLPDRGLRDIPHRSGAIGGAQGERAYFVVSLDAGGRAELQALASADLELRAVDRLREPLAVLQVPPLGPEEQREVQLAVGADLGAVGGRVLDEEGRALPRVTVYVRADEEGQSALDTTDADGRFGIAPLARERALVRLERDGFVVRVLEQVDTRGGELELRMQRGLELLVDVRDPSAAPVRAEQVDAAPLDRARPDWHGVAQAPGSHLLRDLPPERLRVRARVGGHRYEREHDPRDGPLRIAVPHHGALELAWDPPEGRGAVQVLATSPADPTFELDWSAGFLPQADTTIPALLPGRYTVQLRVWDSGEQEWRLLSQPTTVQVEAGRTTRAVLAP